MRNYAKVAEIADQIKDYYSKIKQLKDRIEKIDKLLSKKPNDLSCDPVVKYSSGYGGNDVELKMYFTKEQIQFELNQDKIDCIGRINNHETSIDKLTKRLK